MPGPCLRWGHAVDGWYPYLVNYTRGGV